MAQLAQQDLVTLAPTGSGKTLPFWIPLLFNAGRIMILVTPLVVLGDKNVAEPLAVSIPVTNLMVELTSDATFKAVHHLYKCLCVLSSAMNRI